MHLNFLLGAMVMATAATAQTVVGKAYGFATGVTGGGSAKAVTPTSASELAKLLADDVPRTIVINKTWDFTGSKATGSGCDRNNKSIIGSGAGVLNGKGLQIKKNAKNVIIQGFEIRNVNPGIVWGGDAIDLKGGNDGVWIDHMKISLVGRMFIVTHYDGSRVTVSNSEFDGQTTTSASCNGDHYWTMMFYGKGDRVTLDRNYYHDVSGRAPKLGQDGTTGTFQATNNYFKNMQGHAFDIYSGATALIEGNVFETVKNPFTSSSNKGTVYNVPDSAAASACSSALGRACEVNKASGSGTLLSLKTTSALSTLAKSKSFLVKPVAASQVSSIISSSVGPTRLKARSIRGRWVRY
ncbi:hypothetical protein BN1723_012869 [Verticillium longisporum]|uniref:pectin lyase n=1 Tax=Verticillium longisporum TaxID=100787 RepID=A0A0G4LM57_VERLO|nr:hypothetical protein BN1723_012869 [Verticillium longisporum]